MAESEASLNRCKKCNRWVPEGKEACNIHSGVLPRNPDQARIDAAIRRLTDVVID